LNPAARRFRALGEPAAVAALGALQTLAFVVAGAWALPIACLALLVWRLNAAGSAGRAAWLGWCYGVAWIGFGVWWLYVSMHRYGGLPAWLAILAVLALASALALFLTLACALYHRWRSRRAGADALRFAALWLLAELGRGLVLTGFPWVASGYSQVDSPLAGLAPWVGVYGIGAVLAFTAALFGNLSEIMPGRRWLSSAALVLAIGGSAALGTLSFTSAAGSLTVTLLQTNVAQDEKFAADRMPDALQWTATQLLASQADLVVAPETAVPLLPDQLADFAPGYWQTLQQHFRSGAGAALIGVPLGDFDTGYTNSVVGLSAAAATLPGGQYRYDKAHLVPFGEFIPRGFRWFTELMRIPLGDFNRGVAHPPSFLVGGQRVAPNICYEDLFGEELALRFADPARAPTMFVNVSNIGWFGDSVAITQHLNISRMRSLEFQRPMLRATNTGATALIDHQGQVIGVLPRFQRALLTGRVVGRDGVTPFAAWCSRFGLWPLPLAALILLGALAAMGRRR